jgi:muramidase (phage lysozyme)
MTKNQQAFLDMIAVSEIGIPLLKATTNGYNVLVGATAAHPLTFTSYADHPNILNKSLKSTAAGRYQLLHRYYDPYCRILGLTDFLPSSQDAIALQQIKECRAFADIEAGNITSAISKCAHIWASLPGASYGQHENKLDNLLAAYQKSGGALA